MRLFNSLIGLLLSVTIASAITLQITEPIRITNNNQTLKDSSFFLANHANCPVIIIGNDYGPPITNITIINVDIDGNFVNQDREEYTNSDIGVQNNNGIIIQNAKYVYVTKVSIHDCRSGGLVTSRFVSNLTISNLITYHNFFDGLACYHTTDSKFIDISSFDNCAAGLSFDLLFDRNTLTNIALSGNTIGIFMRDSNFNEFNRVAISDTELYELFVAQVDKDTNKACSYNKFSNISLETDKVFTNDISCIGNVYDITIHSNIVIDILPLPYLSYTNQNIKQNENNKRKWTY